MDELTARRRRKADSQTVYRAQLKADCVRAYGGRCQCCGCDDIGLLQFDHVNRDGADHRKWMGRNRAWTDRDRSSDGLHRWLRDHGYPQGVIRLYCEPCHRSASLHPDNQCHRWHPFTGHQLDLFTQAPALTGTG